MWPTLELRAGRDADGAAVLMLVGPEPDHQWKAFAADVAELAALFSVRILVGLGAFPAPVPHTRPARLAATASTAHLPHRVGSAPATLAAPAGPPAPLAPPA